MKPSKTSLTSKSGSAHPQLRVNGYSERWLRQGFCWVYPAEVVSGRVEPGQIVQLQSAAGEALGTAIADDGWIAARRFRPDGGPLDPAWVQARLSALLVQRQRWLDPDTNAFRWINAEGDDFPGVRLDVYDRHLVLSLDSASLERLVEPICAAAAGLRSVESVHVALRPDPRETRKMEQSVRCVRGQPPGDIPVRERGLIAMVRPSDGKDPGLYTDMRDNRAWLAPFWKDRRVLNLFAYTGMFSVAAAAHGAAEVVSVDLSASALERARANFAANALPVDPAAFLAEDVFAVLDRFRRKKRLFDVVLLDPPGASHSYVGHWSGEKDYPRLVSAALHVLDRGGWLIAASNLGSINPRQFQGFLTDGARRAGRSLRLLHEGSAAPDHGASLHFPEGRYLKFWVCTADD